MCERTLYTLHAWCVGLWQWGDIKGLAAAAGNARVKTNYQLDPLRHVKVLVEMQQPLVAMVWRIHDTAL